MQVDGTGPTYSAHVIGYDVADDIAVVQIENAPSLKTIKLGSSANVAVGDAVVAIGNALGRGGTPTASQGTITGVNKTITASDDNGANAETLNGLLELNAPIQPGDSGGPVVNASGAVIGMDSAASTGRFNQASNDAYAIPIDTAMAIANQIRSGDESGNVHVGGRALLGVLVQNATGGGTGVQVQSVDAGSPAASVGIGAGDTIVSIGSTTIGSLNDVSTALVHAHPGDTVRVGWLDTSGQRHDASVTLTTGPPA